MSSIASRSRTSHHPKSQCYRVAPRLPGSHATPRIRRHVREELPRTSPEYPADRLPRKHTANASRRQYVIGQSGGIYWRETDPPERGAEAPDWFYVPNVPPLLDGEIRRSYVLWREYMVSLIAIELASGDSSEERDNTPLSRSPEG